MMQEFGFIPVVNTMENSNMDPLSKSISEYAAAGKTISWPMSYWPSGIVDVYLVPIAQEFFTTDMTAQAFLEALTNAFVEAGK
jgi:raffinose/stachyose/melibiose transport system substrate-binding protein